MIDSSISFSSTKRPCQWTITKLDSIKLFIKSFLCSKVKKFANLAKALNFFPAFLQSDIKYSSNLVDGQL